MELKKKLLETRRIPLDAILEKAKASEAAKTNAVYDVWSECKCHRKQRRKGRGPVRKKTCFICGKKGRFARDPCPTKGRKCAKSLKYGHFASCCKGNHFPLESGKDSQPKRASNGKKRAGRQTNQMGGYSE